MRFILTELPILVWLGMEWRVKVRETSVRWFTESCLFRDFCVFFYSSDLRTMTERLKSGYFSSKKLFIADMMRIFTNCRTYNAPETEYYKCANTVERFFLSKVKELRKTWRKHQTWKKDIYSAITTLFKRLILWKIKWKEMK